MTSYATLLGRGARRNSCFLMDQHEDMDTIAGWQSLCVACRSSSDDCINRLTAPGNLVLSPHPSPQGPGQSCRGAHLARGVSQAEIEEILQVHNRWVTVHG